MIMESKPFIEAIASQSEMRPSRNENFWNRYRAWKSEMDAWDAAVDLDPEMSDEDRDRWGGRVYPLLVAMWMTPVDSAQALLAKCMASEMEEAYLPAPAGNTTVMMGWDLERIAKKEIWGDASGGPRVGD